MASIGSVFCAFTKRLRKRSDLCRIDDHYWQSTSGQSSGDQRLETAGRLDRHHCWPGGFQAFDQIIYSRNGAGDSKTLTGGR
jgi:hypothetical protein